MIAAVEEIALAEGIAVVEPDDGGARTYPVTRQTASASGQARTYQAGRDLSVHYYDGVHKRRRTDSGASGEVCPYPGLASFGRAEARWFFGRDGLIAELVERLDDRLRGGGGVQLVVAPSGAGKSSLLDAGLICQVERGVLSGSAQWPVVRLTPTAQPLHALASAVGTDRPEDAAHAARELADGRRVLIVVDQFEELFTLCQDPVVRGRFIDVLAELAGSVALVVLGMRADFYAACVDYPLLRVALQDRPLVVGPLSESELREAIILPARDVGLDLEPGLVELLVADLGGGSSRSPRYAAERLPLLAHALRTCWRQREGGTLTVQGYRTAGGIHGAVAKTADDAFASLDLAGQWITRMLFRRLVRIGENTDPTRRRVTRAELVNVGGAPAVANRVLDVFTQTRLLTSGQDSVEITHEALLTSWPMLHRWIEDDRASRLIHQDLDDAATAWSRSPHDSSLLYRGTRLETATAWAHTVPPAELSPDAARFLAASRRHHALALRRRRAGITILAVTTVAALLGIGVAYVNARRADTSAHNAEQQHALALSRQLAAQSQIVDGVDKVKARQLAAAAWTVAHTEEASRRLTSLLAEQQTVLVGHTTYEGVLVYSPDSTRLASEADDGTIRLWNPVTGEQIGQPLAGHRNGVYKVAFNGDSTRIASVGADQMLRLWDTATGRQIAAARFDRPEATEPFVLDRMPERVAFSPDLVRAAIVGPGDGSVRLWNIASGQRIDPPLHIGSTAAAVAFSPDGKQLVTAGENGEAMLWNAETGEKISSLLTGRAATVTAVAFDPAGTRVVTAGRDGDLRLWNARTGQQIGLPFAGGVEILKKVVFGPDGVRFVTVSNFGTVQLWNMGTRQALGTPIRHPGSGVSSVPAVAFSPDGKRLVTAGRADFVRQWDTSTGQPLDGALSLKVSPLGGELAFDPNGRQLAAAIHDGGRIELSYVPASQGISSWADQHAGPLLRWDLSPDGTMLASTENGRQPRLWDARSGWLIGELVGESSWVFDVAFSPDGARIATGGGDGMARLWDTRTRQQVGPPLDGRLGQIMNVAFSPDGAQLATAGTGDKTQLWDTRTGQRTGATLTGGEAMAFSPDGTRLATAGDRTVRLWNTVTGQQVGPDLVGHTDFVLNVVFSPDGTRLATVGADRAVRLWDTTTGQPIGAPLRHDENVYGLVFSPDGSRIAVSAVGSVTIWNTATTSISIRQDTSIYGAMALSPDGTQLVFGRNDLRLWDVATGEQVGPALTQPDQPVLGARFSKDGSTLTIVFNDRPVEVRYIGMYRDPTGALCHQVGPISEETWHEFAPEERMPDVCAGG